MIRRLSALACIVSTLSVAGPVAAAGLTSTKAVDLPAGHYVLDNRHASLTGRLSHMGFSTYTFRFNSFDGSFDYAPQTPAASKVSVTVNVASIDTGLPSLDAELGTGWLESAKFPTATFVSTSLDVGDGRKGKLMGNLTLHGVTKPVVLAVVFNGSGTGMRSETRTGFSATTTIQRSAFGVSKLVPVVGDTIDLVIEAEFTKQ